MSRLSATRSVDVPRVGVALSTKTSFRGPVVAQTSLGRWLNMRRRMWRRGEKCLQMHLVRGVCCGRRHRRLGLPRRRSRVRVPSLLSVEMPANRHLRCLGQTQLVRDRRPGSRRQQHRSRQPPPLAAEKEPGVMPAQLKEVLNTAEAVVEGGREGHGRTSDGRLVVDFSVPASMSGDDGPGTNPEQLFAVGYAACFQSALLRVARAATSTRADRKSLHGSVSVRSTLAASDFRSRSTYTHRTSPLNKRAG
jgi:Ohr subfamily peroxiredoxin